MASPSRRHSSHPDQMEFTLEVTPSAGFSVSRLPSGHIVLAPKPVEMWGSTATAAQMIRRSERWVRVLCESKLIKARRLPGARRWDVDLIALQEWIEKGGDQSLSAFHSPHKS